MTVVIVESLLSVAPSYATLRASRVLDHSAEVALGRIVRDIRSAESVVVGQSYFDGHPGRLTLSYIGSSPATVEFYVEDGVLRVREDGVERGALTSGVAVSDLVFRYASNARGAFVKIELTASTTVGKVGRSETYFSGAATRGGY